MPVDVNAARETRFKSSAKVVVVERCLQSLNKCAMWAQALLRSHKRRHDPPPVHDCPRHGRASEQEAPYRTQHRKTA